MKARFALVPTAMALALASLAFNVTGAPTFADGPDPDAGQGFEVGPLDTGPFDNFVPDGTTSCSSDNFQDACASSGTPGCAGGGGAGGSGGQGGAATAALIAIGSSTTVFVTNGAFVVGHGGTGGPGGGGQGGGVGEAGTQGASYACKSSCPSCSLLQTLSGGSPGSGTAGGAGGQGGGGAGGPAFDYVEVNGAKVNIVTPSTLDASVTGSPGAGGPPNGITGDAGVHP